MTERANIKLYNQDCMEAMKEMPDKAFDLAIVDPPYGISVGGSKPFGSVGGSNICMVKTYKTFDDSKQPSREYFIELMRASKNQVIFGGNYFIEHLRNTSCFIVWDKDNSGNFADCELAWTSFNTAVRKFKYRWNGMLQEHMGKNKEIRIHPTQISLVITKLRQRRLQNPRHSLRLRLNRYRLLGYGL